MHGPSASWPERHTPDIHSGQAIYARRRRRRTLDSTAAVVATIHHRFVRQRASITVAAMDDAGAAALAARRKPALLSLARIADHRRPARRFELLERSIWTASVAVAPIRSTLSPSR